MKDSYTVAGASVKVGPSKMLPHHMQSILELSDLFVEPEHRNQGQATALMRQVCYEADKEKRLLVLMPESKGELTNDQLEAFYCGFGFERIQDKPVLMCREPSAKVKPFELKAKPVAFAAFVASNG